MELEVRRTKVYIDERLVVKYAIDHIEYNQNAFLVI